MFNQYSESDIKHICDIMLGRGPTKTASTEGTIASEGAAPVVVSMEVPAVVPMAWRFPRSKPMVMREVPKPKKDKKKKLILVRESSRKHVAT